MKSIRNFLIGTIITGSLAASLHFLHAQTAVIGGFNGDIAPVQSAPDSIIQLTADSLGLPLVSPAALPASGTFFLMVPGPGGIMALPYPCPPGGPALPTYAIINGVFLVDGTGGQVRLNNRLAANGTVNAALAAQAAGVVNLVDQVQGAVTLAVPPMRLAGGMMTMDAGGGFYPGGKTNIMVSAFNFTPDYGTNLYLAQPDVASNYFTGIVSNTFADIQYEIQYTTDLTQTNWQSANWFVYGSEVTNWTPFSVPAVSPTNLFLRVRSWQDDGSGLPIWWQLQYFGTTGVDPYGDPAGDGWNNLQKFQNGMNPNVFYTPPAPQGLSVAYHPANNTADISWQPSPGSVTGYTVTRNNNGTVTTFNYSSSATSFTDTTQTQTPNLSSEIGGPVSYNPTYQVQAQYAGSHSSASSDPVKLLNSQNSVWLAIAPDAQGVQHLVVSDIPQNTSSLQVTRIGPWDYAGNPQGDTAATSYNVPVASLNNGTYALSDSQAVPPDGSYYAWWAQTVNSDGTPSDVANPVKNGNGVTYDLSTSSSQTPFYDGRAQLKQNLIFLLRAATMDSPFTFAELGTNSFDGSSLFDSDNGIQIYDRIFTYPGDYVYAGFYQPYPVYSTLDVMLPFKENYLYGNFVFDPSELDNNGYTTTGVFGNYDEALNYVLVDRYNYQGNDTVNESLVLTRPSAYEFQPPSTNWTTVPALLATNNTRWLSTYPLDSDPFFLGEIGVTNYIDYVDGDYVDINALSSNARNYFGLQFLSATIEYGGGSSVTLNAGNSISQDEYGGYFYPETAQPQFQTVEYDFLNPNTDSFPGSSTFSATNTSHVLIAGLADPIFQVAGYAKLAVLNGYSGVYGYLGQYFDAAYTEDANGVATTNSAGFLTPYGNFFATAIGPAALVTMPDPDTGERGTDTVYVVGLKLDVNHDGVMDMSYTGPDNTSTNRPYTLWANNNFDRWNYDLLSASEEQDDVLPGGEDSQNADPNDPDCNYKDLGGNRAIPDTRDLEDFARLWVSGVTPDLVSNLPYGSTITLSWGDAGNPNTNNPAIDIFQAVEGDGGIGYLTNETTAAEQIDPSLNLYLGRVSPGQSIQMPAYLFEDEYGRNHLIWCGVSNGTGGLMLTIADGNGNVLGQSTVYIQIKDIKDMYERWTVGDNPNIAPVSIATNAYNDLPTGEMPFHYSTPQDTNTTYILHVHGYNMKPWEKDRFAETEYKRLYWQGYQGRFGAFNWPTAQNAVQFGGSELQAWNSAQGLLNKLEDLNAEYPGNVYLTVHSLGNVVAGEALRLATNQVVNTYVAMQGAVSAHAYDPNTATFTLTDDSGTPDRYAQYYTNGAPCYFNSSAGAGTYVNFFNTNDWALNFWLTFQNEKPALNPECFFVPPEDYFQRGTPLTQLFFPTNTYILFSDVIQARSYALGAQADVGGVFDDNQVNLPSVWPPDVGQYKAHIWHSAEFRSDSTQRWQFWDEVLIKMSLKQQQQ